MKALIIAVFGFWLAVPGVLVRGAEAEKNAAASADPVAQEYQKLLESDQAALDRIEQIFKEAREFEQAGTPTARSVISLKVEQAVQPVDKAYRDFMEKYPEHVEARIAYASFLQEMGDERSAIEHLEKAREIAPNNPTPWNNLANIYGHIGPVKKAFHYYQKAIELNPKEPVYVQNLATTTYLFRKDAQELYRISEEEVFDKALALYRDAMKLDPDNLLLATDYAQSFYGIRPLRVKGALDAWQNALRLATGEVEKQGIYLHLARVELNAGLFEEADKHLAMVTHPEMQDLKSRLQRNLAKKREENGKSDESGKPTGETSVPVAGSE